MEPDFPTPLHHQPIGDDDAPRWLRPSPRMLVADPAHLLAFGFGSGLSPVSPGTVGSLLAWLSYVVFSRWLHPDDWAVLICAGFLVGIWAAERTCEHLGVHDHGAIVWDEIVAFWLVLLFLTPSNLATQCWAFFWFRFFDILKPPPIGYYDRKLSGAGWVGGFGVMFDDLLAAFFTLLLFAIWRTM